MSINDLQRARAEAALTGVGDQPANGVAFFLNSAATTNATLVRNQATNLYEVTISNLSASARYVKFYNKASSPTVGTDVPILTIKVAADSVVSLNFGPLGKRFALGLGYAITGAVGIADTTAVGAGEVQVSGTRL